MQALVTVAPKGSGEGVVLRVEGELDAASVTTLEQVFEANRPRGDVDVVLDVSGLTFVDSTGLACFLRCNRWLLATTGRPLVLRAPQRRVMTALHVTGLDRVFRLEPDPSTS